MADGFERGRRQAVIDGRLAYVSPSSIARFDHDTEGGCGLRGWYRYVLRIPDPAGASAALGSAIHSEIEQHTYPQTTAPLGYWSAPAKPYLPRRPFDVEKPLEHLTAEGLPVVGYMDLVHRTGVYIDSEGEEWQDPAGTVEVVDWKTTSDFKWAKTPQQVGNNIQMVTYAAEQVTDPGVEWVRLSHVYLATRGKPRAVKRTTLLPRAEVQERWNRILPIVRSMKDIAQCSTAAEVPYNTKSCHTWRKPCVYSDRCPRFDKGERSLEDIFGATTAAALLQGENTMSLMDILKPGVADAAKPTTSMAEQLAALEAEEAAAAAKPDPQVEAFSAAWGAVNAAGMGFPALSGEAMALWGKMAKQEPQGAGLAGSGRLGKLTISTLEKMIELAGELGAVVAKPAAAPTVEIPVVEEAVSRTEVSVLPPDAPESDPALASAGAAFAPDGVFVSASQDLRDRERAAAEKPKRGRKPKGNPPGVPNVEVPADSVYFNHALAHLSGEDIDYSEGLAHAASVVSSEGGLALYINAIPSVPYQTLDRYTDDLAARLCREYGAADIRCAPADGPLGFGKWKGALAALARETCPAGTYVAFTRGSEMDEVVADALASKAAIVVRGV